MKVGDLVTLKMKQTRPPQDPHRAIVIDMYTDQDGFEQVEIAWMEGAIGSMRAELFEVISESR